MRADQPPLCTPSCCRNGRRTCWPGHRRNGSIGDAGGTADTLAISATALAAEDSRPGTTGDLVYDSGFAAVMG